MPSKDLRIKGIFQHAIKELLALVRIRRVVPRKALRQLAFDRFSPGGKRGLSLLSSSPPVLLQPENWVDSYRTRTFKLIAELATVIYLLCLLGKVGGRT